MKRSLAGVLMVTALASLDLACATKAQTGAIDYARRHHRCGGRRHAGAVIGAQMDKHARELAADIAGATVQRIGEGIAVTFPEGLLFGFDSDQVGPSARDNLRKLAASLRKYPNTRTLIVGHTDAKGSARYNMDLSDRRARSAANFIAGEGIERDRVGTAGRGETEPIAGNGSDDGRRQNRRVEVAIYAKTT